MDERMSGRHVTPCLSIYQCVYLHRTPGHIGGKVGVSPEGLLAPCGFAREAAERFFSSVIMRAHNFIKPKASP